jgi:hypothetical protein
VCGQLLQPPPRVCAIEPLAHEPCIVQLAERVACALRPEREPPRECADRLVALEPEADQHLQGSWVEAELAAARVEPAHGRRQLDQLPCQRASVRVITVETSLGPASRLVWTPTVSGSRVNECLVLCLAPFVFVLSTADASDLGHDISLWTQWSANQRPSKSERRISLPTADQLQGGLRAMVYPSDYVVP